MNIYGNYGFSTGFNGQDITFYRTVLDTLFDQKGKILAKMRSNNFKAGIDYMIDKKSSIGLIVNGTFVSPEVNTDNRTVISYILTNTVNRILVANSNSKMNRDNYNINLNYQYTGKAGKSLQVNVDKGYYKLNNTRRSPTIIMTQQA